MIFNPKSEFRGLGAVAEAPGFRLFPGSKMDPGRISVTVAHQLRGQFYGRRAPVPGGPHLGAAQNGLSSLPTGGAASSGFCRSARSRNGTSMAITSKA